MIDLIEVID